MGSKRYEEDFKIIRTAIDSAKNPIDKLGQFFKNYAMINIIIVALNLIVNLYQVNILMRQSRLSSLD